jgi:hypothetical protein
MDKLLIRILFFILILPSSLALRGQEPGRSLETGQVEVIRDFDARLEETQKVPLAPIIPEYAQPAGQFDYLLPVRILAVDYPAPKIRPIAMGRDKEPKVYNGYAKAGFGTLSQPYGELGYGFRDQDKLALNVHLLHHAANNSGNRENQRFSETRGNLDFTLYSKDGMAVRGRGGYESDVNYLYGYNQADTSFLKEEVRRRVSLLELGAGIFNSAPTVAGIDYSADADFYRLSESFGASSESGFLIDLEGRKMLDGTHPIGLRLVTDFSTYSDTASQNLHNFFLQPHFTFHSSRFKLRVGANLASHDDEFFVFPDLELEVGIIGSQLGAYVGATGTLEKNSFRNLLTYNPFVASSLTVNNSAVSDWFGGVRGSIRDFGYEVQAGVKSVDNLAIYLPLPVDTRQFLVLYDTATIVYLQGMIGGALNKQLELTATWGTHFFDLKVNEKAWQLPALEANFSAIYTAMQGKWKLRGEVYLADGVPYRNESLDAERLNALFDVSLGAEYLFLDQFGAWLQLNNLANNKRERWLNYPVFGFNVMAGVSARF